jgi:hypothetical protein
MRQDWQFLTSEEKEHQLNLCAQLAVLDYLPGSPLTEFTVLDREDFYEDQGVRSLSICPMPTGPR